MYLWMVYDREGLERNAAYVALYRKHCEPYGLDVTAVLDVDARERILTGERPVCVFVRTIAPEINRFLEEQGIPVFNPSHVSRICNHKGKTLEYLKNRVLCVPSITLSQEEWQRAADVTELDVGKVKQYFGEHFKYSTFEEQERAMLDQAEDFVVKTVDGHGGKEVRLVCGEPMQAGDFAMKTIWGHDGKETGQVCDKRSVVLQPFVGFGTTYSDMRVYVIGRRIVAAVMRSSTEDFRANFSLGGNVGLVSLDHIQRRIVDRITGQFSFGMAGIDFLFDREGRMVLNEIEDVAGARMLYECAPEIDIVREYVAYVLEEKLNYHIKEEVL